MRNTGLHFESLEQRWLLTRTLSVADPVTLIPPDTEDFVRQHVQFVDVNGDSRNDIVAFEWKSSPVDSTQDRRLVVWTRGEGDNFERAAETQIDFWPNELKVADVEGDGVMEIWTSGGDRVWIGSLSSNGSDVRFGEMIEAGFQLQCVFTSYLLSTPCDVELRDVNLDSVADAVVFGVESDDDSFNTRVYLGRIDGGFDDPISYANVGTLADVDNDGFADIVSWEFSFVESRLTVLLNDGSGRFEALDSVSTLSSSPRGAEILDLNLDGNADLLSWGFGVQILYGNGDGTFRQPVEIVAGNADCCGNPGEIYDLTVADVDGDGRDDLFVGAEFLIHGGPDDTTTSPRVVFSTDDGFEVFSLSETLGLQSPVDIVGDARAEFIQAGNALSVVPQIDPTTLEHQVFEYPNLAREFIDVNVDGVVDIVLALEEQLVILEASGDSAASEPFREQVVVLEQAIRGIHFITRLERVDGNPGFVLVAEPTDATLNDVLISVVHDGDRWLTTQQSLPGNFVERPDDGREGANFPLQRTDLNNDGLEDILFVVDIMGEWSAVAYTNTGAGFQSSLIDTYPSHAGDRAYQYERLSFEDVDGDGLTDLYYAYVAEDEIAQWRIAFNRGENGWLLSEEIPTRFFRGFELQDMNADGVLDATSRTRGNRNYDFRVWQIQADGSATAWANQDVGSSSVRYLDVNGDGLVDVVGATHEDEIRVSLSNGDGTWQTITAPEGFTADQFTSSSLILEDFDGDGNAEALHHDHSSFSLFGFDETLGEFTNVPVYQHQYESTSSYEAYLVDFNSDGLQDLVIEVERCSADCPLTMVFLNDPDGLFEEPVFTPVARFGDGGHGEFDLDEDGISESFGYFRDGVGNWAFGFYEQSGSSWELRVDLGEFAEEPNRHDFSATDVNEDGIQDIVIFTRASWSNGNERIYNVRFGEGDWQFSPPVVTYGGVFGSDGLVVDDGIYGSAVSVMRTSGDATDWETIMLGHRETPANVRTVPSPLAVFDVDADGDDDVVMLDERGITTVRRVEPGDFNDDGLLDANDLDALFARLGSAVPEELDAFDLNRNHQIDQRDIDLWVVHSARTALGDTNLDGVVGFGDFLALSGNFGRTDATWRDGDFNGDGVVDFFDYLTLSRNFGFDRAS